MVSFKQAYLLSWVFAGQSVMMEPESLRSHSTGTSSKRESMI